ncbi:MAG: hypothetical protein HYZ58_06975 [Acidobacteria bacterium]|nr:hypothetical protein [Acidobacteriota bacterium]MBI3262877.1 hypothetical protein [Acidobacteriota bacterium]
MDDATRSSLRRVPAPSGESRSTPTHESALTPAHALLDTWCKHDWTNGVQVDQMMDLESLSVRTMNSTYEITILSARSGEVMVRGGRFFPEFTNGRVAGSSLGGSFLKLRGIYVGFNLEIYANGTRIVTSPVKAICHYTTPGRPM